MALAIAGMVALGAGCNKEGGGGAGEKSGGSSGTKRLDYPATADGAKTMLAKFLEPNADAAALSKSLRPDPADYKAVFTDEAADKLQKAYDPGWDGGQLVIRGNPGQTEVLVRSAGVEDLKTGQGSAGDCPGGYKDAAPHMKAGVTVYCFKFVEPGKTLGMAYDGLVHVNGHWVIFPKPWRALK
jgi:hypothetical protein